MKFFMYICYLSIIFLSTSVQQAQARCFDNPDAEPSECTTSSGDSGLLECLPSGRMVCIPERPPVTNGSSGNSIEIQRENLSIRAGSVIKLNAFSIPYYEVNLSINSTLPPSKFQLRRRTNLSLFGLWEELKEKNWFRRNGSYVPSITYTNYLWVYPLNLSDITRIQYEARLFSSGKWSSWGRRFTITRFPP